MDYRKRKKVKLTKIIIICFLFIFGFNILSHSVFGAVSSYGTSTGTVTPKLDEAIDDDDSFTSIIAGIVYIIAWAVEWLVRGIFKIFMNGTNMFPWADRVIFNAVPFLDINFINPNSQSLFGGSSAIAGVISSMYYTVFTLAVAFLGVCVGVMALRLVVASIAEEKAKYKQALMQVSMAIIMLFLSHYMISFIFYVNEKMVEVASSILVNALNAENISFAIDKSFEVTEDVISNNTEWLSDDMKNTSTSPKDVFHAIDVNTSENNELKSTKAWQRAEGEIEGHNIDNEQFKKMLKGEDSNFRNLKYYMFNLVSNSNLSGHKDYYTIELKGIMGVESAKVLSFTASEKNQLDSGYRVINFYSDLFFLHSELDWYGLDQEEEVKKKVDEYVAYTIPDSISSNSDILPKSKRIRYFINTDGKVSEAGKDFMSAENLSRFFVDVWKAAKLQEDEANKKNNTNNNDSNNSSDSTGDTTTVATKAANVFSSMGEYFKTRAYYNSSETSQVRKDGSIAAETATKKMKFNIVASILYAVFLFQSIMYFIAYMKRFFYVTILALFAPIVIVFDFLTSVIR